MNSGQQILFFFSALGAFNGLLLSTYLLLFKKQKSAATYFLALLLLALSIRITKVIFSYFYPDLPNIYRQIGLSACFLIGPSLYYFTKAALLQLKTAPAQWKYIYSFWIALITIIGLIVPYASHPWDWNHYIVHIIYAQWAGYFALTGWLLRTQISTFFSSRGKLSSNETTILSIFGANTIIFIAYLIVFIWSIGGVYIAGALFFSLLLYLNIPLFVNRNKATTSFLSTEEVQRYGNKKIPDDQANLMEEKLKALILTNELYKDADLKLNDLAKLLKVSSHLLSQLLNDNLQQSFSGYINQYRIQKACELISEGSPLRLEEIGYEVGFNSKSTFYAAFKKHTGTTPTLYREQQTVSVPLKGSADL